MKQHTVHDNWDYPKKNKEQIALKLNRLKDKAVRYKSHKDFLSQCIAEEPVPKDLELELGHRIGNYD